MAVGFGLLQDRNDGMFSVSVFFLLRDFKNSRFCWVTRFQWPSVLVGYVISLMVSFQYC